MAWMKTDYSKCTYFRWKIKWRLEYLGALGAMGENRVKARHLGHRFEEKVFMYQVFLRFVYFVVLLTHFTDDEALHSLWMLQLK